VSRGYGAVRPSANRVYSVQQVLELYQICRNTLSNWIAAGLRPVADGYSQLFRGAELKWFHDHRALGTGRPLHPGEFKCLSCKARVVPKTHMTKLEDRKGRSYWAHSICPDCGGKLPKILNETTYDKLRECLESNTSLHTLGEGEGALPACIGTKPMSERPRFLPENERIIHQYQIFAGRYHAKTLDAHLAAIRDFEAFCEFKALRNTTTADANRYRGHLINGRHRGLSRSTIRHSAAYLRDFFAWLVEQEGCRRMNKTICDYFKLPKGCLANAIQPEPRALPTTKAMELIISEMPTRTRTERRDRAIVGASFLFGTRSDATASLRVGSIDVDKKMVFQDADVMRIKNGKSQTTRWFPLGEQLEQVVIAWVQEQIKFGYGSDDALFPADADLSLTISLPPSGRRTIEPWSTDQGVRRAFHLGCASAGLPYFNPHSARHYLISIRDEHCKTAEQRKAWSYNLGHENEKVTEASYAKMTDQRRNEIFDNLMVGDVETEGEKDLLLAYHEHQLTPGTPEFEQAQRLHEERLRRRRRG
jgi:site-specific recombinase XerD